MLKLFSVFILIMLPLSAFAGDKKSYPAGESAAIKKLRHHADGTQNAAKNVLNNKEELGTAEGACINDGGTVGGGVGCGKIKLTSNKHRKGKKRAPGKVARPKVGEGKAVPASMLHKARSYGGDGVVPPVLGGGDTQSKTSTRGAAKQAPSNKTVREPATEETSGTGTGPSSAKLFTKRTKENQGIVCDSVLGEDDGIHSAEAKLTKTSAEADLAPRIEQCWNNQAYRGAYNKGERRYLNKSGCTYSAGAAQARQQQEKGGTISPHAKWCHSTTRKMSDMYAAGWTDVNNKAKGIEAKAAGIEQEEAEEMRARAAAAEWAEAHPSEKIDWGAVGAAAMGIISDTGAALQVQADKEAKEAARNQRIRDDIANQNAQIAADNANANRNSTYTNHIGGRSSSSNSGGGGYSGNTSSGGGGGPAVCTGIGTFGKLENVPCPK